MMDPDLIAEKVRITLGSGQKVPSPCISVCRMDANTGWCEGCLRRLEEIGLWSSLDDAARRAVWVRIGERAQKLKAAP